jgi:signal transduction histidine kinase
MFFGGMNGFTVFQPSAILPNRFVPPLVLTELKVLNEAVRVQDKTGLLPKALHETTRLKFRYNEAIFSIGFAALDYLNPGSNQYAFKLEGLDKDWNYRVGPAEARYTIQRPGVYQFRIKGGNSDGIWNPEEKQIEIVVLPPPWRSTWAYIGYFLLIGLGLYGVFHLFQLRHRLQMEHWSKVQQEELNEMKLRFFTNITHEFRTPLTLILGAVTESSPGRHKKNAVFYSAKCSAIAQPGKSDSHISEAGI